MRSSGIAVVLLAMALAALGCGPGAPQEPPRVPEPDPVRAAAVARAERAMNALQTSLMARLRQAMDSGGTETAVTVCRDEAVATSDRINREYGITIGRTSHRLRNPVNAPRPWAADIVKLSAGSRADAVTLRVVDLGDWFGVLRPIGTVDLCSRCHGEAGAVRTSIGGVLAAAYPGDEAVGFKTGDLRGWMWAEVPKEQR